MESMHREERIKVLGKKIQLLEGVQVDKGFRMGEGRWWRKRKGKQAQKRVSYSAQEGLEDEAPVGQEAME